MFKRIPLFLVLLQFAASIQAQDIEAIKKEYADREYIMLKNYQKVVFAVEKDNVVAESKHEKEYLVLSKNNATAYSKYKLYHSTFNELKDWEAYTKLTNERGKDKKIKVVNQNTTHSKSASVFYDDVKETSFDFAGLESGAIQTVNYTTKYTDAHLLSPYYLPLYLPVVNAILEVQVPNDMELGYIEKNNEAKHFTLQIENSGNKKIYKWIGANKKAIEIYGDAPDDSYYTPHIIFFLKSATVNNAKQSYQNDLKDLYRWNYNHLKNLNPHTDEVLVKTVETVIAGAKTEREKVNKIYSWVQSNIKYVAFENGLEGFVPRQAADVCTKRYGDCKDMSSIITKMLQIANIKAYYTWIGTRSIPYSYEEVHSPIVDNHMISVAQIDGKWYFLDGTHPNATLDMPPSGIQGKEALIAITPDEYKVLTVPTAASGNTKIVDSTYIMFTDAGVKGQQVVTYTGYFGSDFYSTLLYRTGDDDLKSYIKSRTGKASNKFILKDYTLLKTNPQENVLTLKADYEIPGYGKKIGNEYYINLNLEKLLENREIDTAKRKLDMEREYKSQIIQHHILEIPQGYKASYIPPNHLEDNDIFKYTITYTQKNNKIIASQYLEDKKLLVTTKDFAVWNTALKRIAQQYKEQLVLEKIN
jgi:Domain of Unknown Function with PDB structure (DUF3857)/Transglutaminase-like superfamily